MLHVTELALYLGGLPKFGSKRQLGKVHVKVQVEVQVQVEVRVQEEVQVWVQYRRSPPETVPPGPCTFAAAL